MSLVGGKPDMARRWSELLLLARNGHSGICRGSLRSDRSGLTRRLAVGPSLSLSRVGMWQRYPNFPVASFVPLAPRGIFEVHKSSHYKTYGPSDCGLPDTLTKLAPRSLKNTTWAVKTDDPFLIDGRRLPKRNPTKVVSLIP